MAKKTFFLKDQSTIELAYLAGIIDGEGCFYIGHIKQGKYGTRQQWHCYIKITSCDICLMKWLQKHFTGTSNRADRWTSKKAFERPVYSWTMGGESLDYHLERLEPFLVIKKEHCKIMMKFRKTFKNWGSRGLPEYILKERNILMKDMRKHNSRFHGHELKQ